MKIEIRRTQHTAWQWKEWLSNRFKELGQGSYGAAYALPNGNVLKITLGYDKAYRAWIRTALKYQGNPWMPRIVRAVRMLDVRTLREIKEAGPNDYNSRLRTAEVFMVELERLHESYRNHDIPWFRPGDFVQRADGVYRSTICDHKLKHAVYPTPHDYEADRLISDLLARGFHEDVRYANVLMRDDGHPVLTDPICGG